MILKQCILAATMVWFGVSNATAASCSLSKAGCNLPGTVISQEQKLELGKEFDSYLRSILSGKAHNIFGQYIIDKYTTKLAGASTFDELLMFTSNAEIAKIAKESVNYLKIATVVKAVAQNDTNAIRDLVVGDLQDKTFETFLSEMGITSNANLVAALIAAIKITKESFATLEQEDCLTNIDISYYNFSDDKNLRWSKERTLPPGATDYYFENYLFGGGTDPSGGDRIQNRRNFQCYINESLPKDERIEVSTITTGDGAGQSVRSLYNVFAIIGDTMRASSDLLDNKRLRLPLTVMLRDFNARMDIEEQIKELQRLRRTMEFQRFEAAIEVMRTTEEIENWLCQKLKDNASKGAGTTASAKDLAPDSASVSKPQRLKRRPKLIRK